MEEGKLYCERCGEDIHIVPDFEPELERSMELTMDGILEELEQEASLGQPGKRNKTDDGAGEEPEEGDGRPDSPEASCGRRGAGGGRRLFLILGVLAAFFLLAAGMAVWTAYSHNSEQYLVRKAEQYVAAGKYDRAVSCYSRALELDSDNIQLIFQLAEVYLMKDNKIEYEYLLREIIKNKNATIEQLDSAYSRLISIYRARGDYQTINDLLLASENETLLSTYQSYIAREPEFSVLEGYYTSIQPLRLTVIGSGKIYYTVDGSQPTEGSSLYTAPIILDSGDYVIKAFFVNENGVASSVVTREYHIDNDEISAPELNAISGKYTLPLDIEVLDDEGDVHYTTDGTDPTYSSPAYTAPIPMPLGKSTFRFARVVDGVTGKITERTFELEMDTDFTPAAAVDSVVEYVVSTGKLLDTSGRFDDTENRYLYLYQYVTDINEAGYFYVVAEALRSEDGSTVRTGNNYAVNAYTRELFKLQQDSYDNLFLIEIEQKTESNESP